MLHDPAFWVLAIAFTAIFIGVFRNFTSSLVPFDTDERLPFGLVIVGIVSVVGVTISKLLS